jgi:GAF domain-containing protein
VAASVAASNVSPAAGPAGPGRGLHSCGHRPIASTLLSATPSAGCAGALPAAVLAETVRAAVACSSPPEILRVLTELASQTGPCDAATITAIGPGQKLDTVASTDGQAEKADRWQYDTGQGPCVDAAHTNAIITAQDLRTDDRWPTWAERATELGIGATVSVHLFTDTALGSLNLYSTTPRRYGHDDLDTARVLAAHISAILGQIRVQQNLWRAIDARNLIGQAQGMLMQRYHLTPDKAFALLRRYSQNHNMKIITLAEQLITTWQLPGGPSTTDHN